MLFNGRISTLLHEAVRRLTSGAEQPEFERRDQQMWDAIFGDCFDFSDANEQDHIVGLREGTARYGIWGVDTRWNKLPCNHWTNCTWKNRFKNALFDHIVTDTWNPRPLTVDTTTFCRYMALLNWIQYCQVRGAQLWITGIATRDSEIDRIIRFYCTEMSHEILHLFPNNNVT